MNSISSVLRTLDPEASSNPHSIQTDRQQPTSIPQINRSIALLVSKKDEWATKPVHDRLRLLDAVASTFTPLCEAWVHLSLDAKGAQQDLYASGWEWASGPMPILRYLNALKRTMTTIHRTGRPPLPSPLVTRPNGQISVRVYPTNFYERLTTPGTTIDVRMEPDLSKEDVLSAQAYPYFQTQPDGKVCLVLGAGNVSGGPVNDSLTKLFVDNCVVLLKMSPVNDYLGQLIETALDSLISEGYLQVVYGGASEGSYITSHDSIDCIHMMGAASTYEKIVYGSGPEGQCHRSNRHPICAKTITAELGNVAPAIIVPGPWSERDLVYQAQQLAANLCDSGSYSCSRTRVIVQHSRWSLRHRLLDRLEAAVSGVPARAAYYPGAIELYERFVSAHPYARPPGVTAEGTLPWTVIPGTDSSNHDEICFTTESFCPVIAETSLEAPSAAEFVACAVDFANNHLWGSLSASIIVHPQSSEIPMCQRQ